MELEPAVSVKDATSEEKLEEIEEPASKRWPIALVVCWDGAYCKQDWSPGYSLETCCWEISECETVADRGFGLIARTCPEYP